uniref:dual-specificity RNA methyltransferase RlmN n=1 Tax=Erigeron canadensis TaxID=72917 RepID=UPI001CB8F4E0|nr:dual-specificity RNA methyltransferase RlmN [Erigeron canadensis]
MVVESTIWMRRLMIATATTTTTTTSTTVFRRTTNATASPSYSVSKPSPPPLLSPIFHHRRRSFSTSPASQTLHNQSFSSLGVEDGGINSKDSQKVILKGMRYQEFQNWVTSQGYRPAQALMLWKLLYGNNSKSIWAHSCEELEGLNKDLTMMLSKCAKLKALQVKDIITASDGTRKILFRLDDGLVIETVIIPNNDRGRNTVCVSSQVGCAMNCQFCFTGRMGLRRNLTAAEIVEQAVFARRLFTDEVGPITNVVFMGMGEPLQNIDNVLKAADVMVDEQGLHFSPNKVTISTSGLVPQIKRFLRESKCALAVSLNATTDEVRNWIMPINRKYNLNVLLETLREELHLKHKYKVLFEYVMLAGVNDSIDDAKRIIDLVKGIPCKINLITFNPHSGSYFQPTTDAKMVEFRNILAEGGCVVLMRPSRGDDQMAACGQLGNPGEFQAPLLKVPPRFQASLEPSI